ncbi:hypothetical protein [Streptomyces goshikiensis]
MGRRAGPVRRAGPIDIHGFTGGQGKGNARQAEEDVKDTFRQ